MATANLDTLADKALDDAHDIDNTANRDTMRRYVADGAIELVEEHNWEHLRNTWEFPTVDGEAYYRFTAVDWVYSMTQADGTPILRVDKEDIDRLSTSADDVQVFANWGWDDGIIVKLSPTPGTSTQTINLNGVSLQPRVSATTDVPVAESRFEELLILGGVWRWKRYQQHSYDAADRLRQEWIYRVSRKRARDAGAKGPLRFHLDDFRRAVRARRRNEGI